MTIIEFVNKNNVGTIKKGITFAQLTFLKVGGPIKYVVWPNSIQSLVKLFRYCNENDVKVFLIGKGSNILASSNVFDGLVVSLDKMEETMSFDGTYFQASSNVNLKTLAQFVSQNGYKNCEFFSGIPGSVGGAIYMNAGAYKKEMSDVVSKVECIDNRGKVLTLEKKDLDFGYRSSVFQKKKQLVVTKAYFTFEKEEICEEAKERMKRWEQNREITQPLNKINAGSTFRNPTNNYAWKLIDEVGLRGYQIGGAKVSMKHANFIINDGTATPEDFRLLMNYVIDTVYSKLGIHLECEWELINW